MTDLFVTQLVEAISDIRSKRTTGALRLTVGGGMRMAFFEDGALVYYASDDAEDALGPSLTRPGRLDSEEGRRQLAEIEPIVSRKQPLIGLLLEKGVVDPERLRGWLAEHFYEAFARMFDSHSGSVKLMMGIKAEHPLSVNIPVSTLVLEAVRRMTDDWVIHETLGPLDYTTEPSPDHGARLETMPLSFYDGLVASQITQKIALSELIMITGLPEADATKALLALRLSGVLEPFEPPKKQTDTGRLRMRQAALDSGIPLDAEGAAVAFAMGTRQETVPVDGALTMGEFTGTAHYESPSPPVVSDPELSKPGEPTRQRGDTAKLRLISSAYKQMAEAEVESGNIAGAIQFYESAIAQSPDSLELLLGVAKLLVDRANGFKSAEKYLERACQAHPKEVKPRVELAKLYRTTGRHTQADEVLHQARRLDPEDPVVNAMLQKKDEKAGGGFFSRLRGSSGSVPEEAKPKPEPFAKAPRTNLKTTPETTESGSLVSKRCRHCGNMCRAGAAACNRCGATI